MQGNLDEFLAARNRETDNEINDDDQFGGVGPKIAVGCRGARAS